MIEDKPNLAQSPSIDELCQESEETVKQLFREIETETQAREQLEQANSDKRERNYALATVATGLIIFVVTAYKLLSLGL